MEDASSTRLPPVELSTHGDLFSDVRFDLGDGENKESSNEIVIMPSGFKTPLTIEYESIVEELNEDGSTASCELVITKITVVNDCGSLKAGTEIKKIESLEEALRIEIPEGTHEDELTEWIESSISKEVMDKEADFAKKSVDELDGELELHRLIDGIEGQITDILVLNGSSQEESDEILDPDSQTRILSSSGNKPKSGLYN